MFESVLYQLLVGYLGHYVKDINREHFRLGLWNGEAVLENVDIRLEAFDYLQLPFAIKQGFVGKLRLQVPWSRLGRDSILIALEDVTLVAGPHEESEYGAEASERRAMAAKKASLAAAEIAKLSQRVSEDKSGQTFLSYLSAKIIDNVQVTVTNLHIRYMDKKTDPERDFSFGITLASLTIRTTDGRGYPALASLSSASKGGGSPVHKLVQVNQFAVYWNCEETHGPRRATFGRDSASSTRPNVLGAEEEMVYLLRPTTATLRLTVDKRTMSGGPPHYSAAADIDNLSVAVADQQLVQMLLLVDVLSRSRLRERYARFRPQISQTDSSRGGNGWKRRLWTFAIQAVLSDVHKHHRGTSWSYLSWRSERQKRYVVLYKEKLEALQTAQPAVDPKWAELEEMERDFEMDEILYFRSLAENQFQLRQDMFVTASNELEDDDNRAIESEDGEQQQEEQLSLQHVGQRRGWLNWLSLGLLGAAESIDAAVCPDEIIKDLWEAAAGFSPTDEIEARNSLRGQCRLMLTVCAGGAVGSLINSRTKTEIVNILVGGTSVTFSLWQESSNLSVQIPTLKVVDSCTTASQFSCILGPKAYGTRSSSMASVNSNRADDAARFANRNNTTSNSSLSAEVERSAQSQIEQIVPFLKVEFDINKRAKDFDVIVNVTIQPLQFVYSPSWLEQALDFFNRPISLYARRDSLISASEKLESIARHTRAKAEFAFATRKRIGWHLDIQNLTLIFPDDDTGPGSMLMIWAWESLLIVSTELQSTASSSADMAASRRLWGVMGFTRCYERLEVYLVGVQAVIAGRLSSWYEILTHDVDLESHLVERFDFQIALCCLPSDPTEMTHFKLSGEASPLRIRLSSGKCSAVKGILTRLLERETKIKSTDNHEKAIKNVKQGHVPATLELNLSLKVFTVLLYVDGQSDSVLHQMTLGSHLQNLCIRYTRWPEREEMQLMISRILMEDANELAGSSLRYLLFCSDDQSSAINGTLSNSEDLNANSLSSVSSKCSVLVKFSSHRVDGTRSLRLDLSLRKLEGHCHPKVLRALYRFMNALTVSKSPVASGESPTWVDGRENLFKASNWTSSTGAALVLGLDLKEATFHLHDPSGIVAIMKVGDANASTTVPTSGKEVMKVVAVLKEVRVRGPRWASGSIGGDPFGNSSHGPAAALDITISKTRKRHFVSGPKYNVVETYVRIENAHWILVDDYFAILIGYCMSSEWNFGTSKDELGGSQDIEKWIESVNSERTICIVRIAVRDSVVSLPSDSGAEERILVQIPHLVVSFTPAELGRLNADGSKAVRSNWYPEGDDTVQIKCEEVAILFHRSHQHLQSPGGDLFRLVERIDGKATITVPNSDFATGAAKTDDIFGAIPTKTQIHISILHLNMAGPALREGIELLKLQLKGLSSMTWKCKTYAAVGFRHGIKDRSPFLQLQGPPISDSPLDLKCSICEFIAFIKAPQEPSHNVAWLRARKLIIDLSLDLGALQRLRMELLNLDLQYGTSPRSLFHLGLVDDSTGAYESADNATPLFLLANGALHLALPCTKLWLHFAAWSRVIMALAPVAASPAKYVDPTAAMSPSFQSPALKVVELNAVQYQLATESVAVQRGLLSDARTTEALTVVRCGEKCDSHAHIRRTTDSPDSTVWPIQVKIGIMNVVLILPDYVEEAQPQQTSYQLTRRSSRRAQRLWTVPSTLAENSSRGNQAEKIRRGEGNMGKEILLSWSLRIDEIESTEGCWSVKACIMQAEAAIEENACEGQSFRMHFLQATDLGIIGKVSPQHPSSAAFALQVDSVDAWCSYNTLHFLNGFQFEPFRGSSTLGPSLATELSCTLDIRLQSCSLLLSDSRWSCNAPIMEILLGKVFAQVAWKRLAIDASLSSELEINYHNILKVAWEPLLEPWTASYKFSRVHDSSTTSSSRPFHTNSELISSASLNLNVTEALIQAISRAVEMFSDSEKGRGSDDASAGLNIRDPRSAENSSMRRYAPYWLQNDTGVPLYYWICGASRKLKNDDDAKSSSAFGSARRSWGSLNNEVVQPGCSVPLYVEEGPEEVFSRQRAGNSVHGNSARKIFNMHQSHRMICVQLEGTTRPSVPMSIDLVGSLSFEAVFSDGDSGDGGSRLCQGSPQEIEPERAGSFSAPVIFEVTVQRYSKLVRLYSMVSLVNTTSIALELRFDIPFLISPKVLDPVLPGHVMPLPVHLAETGRMRCRPLGNNHLWSDVQLLPNLLQLAETRVGFHRPVACYPFHPSNGAFRCCIAVKNHSIPAAQAVATSSKNKAERKDFMMGRGTRADFLGLGISTSSDDLKGCTSWEISIQAPLVVKNCLPCSLAIAIETSAGVTTNISAPEGDSIFVYDIDTAQDLNFTFLSPTYMPTAAKVPSAAAFLFEMGRNVGRDMKVTTAQELHFIPEISAHASVTAELETEADLITGARELRVSAPFWIYNCSYLNLAVMDGDVDLYSGKELPLGGRPATNGELAEEIALHSTGSRFWPSAVNGLQVLLDETQQESTDRLIKRTARSTSQLLDKAQPALSGPSHFKLGEDPGNSRDSDVEGVQSLLSLDPQEKGDDERARPQIFMYSPTLGTDATEMKLRARVLPSRSNGAGMESEEKLWSRPFSLEPPGGTTTVTIPQVQGSGAFVVAVISAPALGSCAGKTKTITFRPRFLLASVSKQVLCYKQQGTDKFQRLIPGKHSQLHLYDVNREFLVSIRIDEHGWDWSGGFTPDHLGDTQVKVRNHTTGEMRMLRVEVSSMLASTGGEQGAGPAGVSLGTYLILVSDDETGFMPYRIENFTLERLRFHQQKCAKMETTLQPYSSCRYAWDEPCRPHRLVVEVPGAGELGAFWLDEVKEYPVVHLPAASEKTERRWLVNVRAEGPIRVLSVVDGTVHTTKPLGGGDIGPSGEQFQESGQNVDPSAELAEGLILKLSYVGISVIDSSPQEVIYACARGLRLQLLQSQHQQVFRLDVSWLQVDNQLRYAIYPVMLSVARAPPDHSSTHPVLGPQLDAADDRLTSFVPSGDAAISFSVAKWCNPAGSVDCFQYIRMRLEPLRLELEERVVSCLLQFMERVSWSTSAADSSTAVALDAEPWSVIDGSQQYGINIQPFAAALSKYEMVHIPESNTVRFTKLLTRLEVYRSWASAVAVEQINWHSQKLFLFAKERRKAYIEILHVAPIALTVSFSSAPWLADEFGGGATRSLLWMTGTLLQRQVRALADVEGAPVHLRPLKLAHPFASWDVIRGMITRHYTRQLLQEVYKVLGSVDVFGNPVGFIRNMASGVWEFVSAPTRSSIQSPTELVRGMAQGTQSLVTSTVFAFSNAATRMSRAARKGVTLFTMESEYDHAMARLLQLEGSQEVSVVNEFLEGLTGLLQAPIRGAERHGLPGMLSGVALGAVGVIARPVASILEVAGMTAQSIRNRSRPAQWHAARVRLPRHVNDYSALLPYSWERAVGQAVLLEAEGGRFRNEVYFTCKPLEQDGKLLLLTDSKILKVSSSTSADAAAAPANNAVYGPKWKLEWERTIDDVLQIDQVGTQVSVLLGPPIHPLTRTRPQHQPWGSSKYTARFTAFAHETFAFITATDADEVLEMVKLLEEKHRRAQSKMLFASALASSPDFLDLEKFF